MFVAWGASRQEAKRDELFLFARERGSPLHPPPLAVDFKLHSLPLEAPFRSGLLAASLTKNSPQPRTPKLYHFIIYKGSDFIILSFYHFIVLSFYHFIIYKGSDFIILSFYHFIISSFYHFIICKGSMF